MPAFEGISTWHAAVFCFLKLTSVRVLEVGKKEMELIRRSGRFCLSPVHFQNRDENIVEFHKPNTPPCNPTKSAELHHDLVIPAMWPT